MYFIQKDSQLLTCKTSSTQTPNNVSIGLTGPELMDVIKCLCLPLGRLSSYEVIISASVLITMNVILSVCAITHGLQMCLQTC